MKKTLVYLAVVTAFGVLLNSCNNEKERLSEKEMNDKMDKFSSESNVSETRKRYNNQCEDGSDKFDFDGRYNHPPGNHDISFNEARHLFDSLCMSRKPILQPLKCTGLIEREYLDSLGEDIEGIYFHPCYDTVSPYNFRLAIAAATNYKDTMPSQEIAFFPTSISNIKIEEGNCSWYSFITNQVYPNPTETPNPIKRSRIVNDYWGAIRKIKVSGIHYDGSSTGASFSNQQLQKHPFAFFSLDEIKILLDKNKNSKYIAYVLGYDESLDDNKLRIILLPTFQIAQTNTYKIHYIDKTDPKNTFYNTILERSWP